jgi:hypothetical protein
MSSDKRGGARQDRRPGRAERPVERQRPERPAFRDREDRFAGAPRTSPSTEGATREGAVVVSRRGAQR